MTSSRGGSARGRTSHQAADSSDMNSHSQTAAGSSLISMARSSMSMRTAARRTPGRLTIRTGRIRRFGSGFTPRRPPSHRQVAESGERSHRAGSGAPGQAVSEPAREVTAALRSGAMIDRPTHNARCRATAGGGQPRGRRRSGGEFQRGSPRSGHSDGPEPQARGIDNWTEWLGRRSSAAAA